MTDKKRQEVYLAALLHDIGKFYQRADEKPYWNSNISETSRKLADMICPKTQNGYLGYHHVIWTHEFFENTQHIWKQLGLYQNIFDNNNSDGIIPLSIYHHNPSTELQAIIQLADWWASGIDREKDYEGFTKNNDYSNFRNVSLMSVWEMVKGIHDTPQNEGSYAYCLNKLNIDDSKSCYPQDFNTISQSASDYNKLWKQFIDDFKKIDTDSVEAFAETLLYLMKKYLWCIPASTMKGDLPTSSLFEHSKITAAFANCINIYKTNYPDAVKFDRRIHFKDNHYPVLLFCGDISGIQNFIYNVTSKNAALSLKGRSFYLQLLTESIIQRIIQDLSINTGHIVYASGGKFFMLLPNTEDVKLKLSELGKQILKGLLEDGHSDLYFCMDYIPFIYKFDTHTRDSHIETEGTNNKLDLGKLWELLLHRVNEKKYRKYVNLLGEEETFKMFFQADGSGGISSNCSISGVELNKNNKIKYLDDGTIVSDSVFEQIEIGKALKDINYFVTFREPNDIRPKKNVKSINPLNLKIHHYLFDKDQLEAEDSDFKYISSVDLARVKSINDTDFLGTKSLKGNKCSYGYHFYGGNTQAEVNHRYKTFEELAQSDSSNFNKLAILRMDVDNLGGIFADGLKTKTFSGYATLSGQLDYFFSGYLNTLRNKDEFKNNINIIYSGGDDIFAVGRWNDVINFASLIRKEFQQFVCNRKDITISAGLVILGPKYPIAKAAELAGLAEDKAKKFNNKQKNAITIFDEPISWDSEFPLIEQLKNRLVQFYNEGLLSSGFIQKIIDFYMMKNSTTDKYGTNKKYVWTSAYYFAKVLKPLKANNTVRKQDLISFIELLQKGCLTTRNIDLYGIAARWAEIEIRSY